MSPLSVVRRRPIVAVLAACATAAAAAHAVTAIAPATRLVSLRADGLTGGDGGARAPSISDDGRFVAYWGHSDDVVPGDTNSTADVFVRDLKTGTNELISVRGDGGGSADRFSHGPSISAKGRFVAFTSEATNLLAEPITPSGGGASGQVYLRDRAAGTTRLVSVDTTGTGSANGHAGGASVSADGRWVAFSSCGTNLVAEDKNAAYDVFVRDMKFGVTHLVSVRAGGGAPGNAQSSQSAISANGRYVAFSSYASDLTADPVAAGQIFVRDLRRGRTRLVSVRSGGGNGSSTTPSISPDGRFIAFESRASDLAGNDGNDADDIFVRDTRRRVTVLASPNAAGTGTADSYSEETSVSANGRWVVFYSFASDLVATAHDGNEHVYLRDVRRKKTTLLTMNATGTAPAKGGSYRPRITPNGRWAVWDSDAPDLVADDTNHQDDVFIRRLR